MPFSSVIGASSVIRPGVCTSTTRPTVPYEGQLIYETDTDRVAAYNGSAWDYTHSSGLVLISSTTIGNAVSSVTVSDAFSSTYDNYRIIVSGGAGSTAGGLGIQMGATTTGYYYAVLRITYAGVATNTFGANLANWRDVGGFNTGGLGLSADIIAPNLAKNTFYFSNQVGNETFSVAGAGGGYLANTTQYTAFSLITSTGTITGGTIKVYGYKN